MELKFILLEVVQFFLLFFFNVAIKKLKLHMLFSFYFCWAALI